MFIIYPGIKAEQERQTENQKGNLQILLEKERIEKYNLAMYLNKLLQ